jgi:diketogulonate reductase-like aldo/keto reductase
VIYGTAWKEDATERCVTAAIAAGFRAFDTANQRKHYFEAGTGAAIAASGLPRDALFLQTKFTFARGQDHRLPYDPAAAPAEQVAQSFRSSLEHLGVSALDSYVLHGPSQRPGLGRADREVWAAMEALHDAGQTRFLGVSNVDRDQLVALCEGARIRPAYVQNRRGLTPAQVVFRFAVDVGMLPLTGTTDPAHMRQDLAAVAAEPLAEGDVARIAAIGAG